MANAAKTPAPGATKADGVVLARGLEVIAKTEVFYRAGLAWTQTPKVVPLSELKGDQVEELKGEPMLIVREVDLPAAPAAPVEASTAEST